MKKSSLLLIAIAIFSGVLYANAQGFNIKSLGFIAPQINGRTNVYNPATGEIVYDSSENQFYGKTPSGWVSLNMPAGSAVPPGTVLPFAGDTAPDGYYIADGSEKDVADNESLYAAIHDMYGTPSVSGKFKLPDYRGRFLRGVDGAAGNDPDASSRGAMAVGGNVGNTVGSIQGDQLRSHVHSGASSAFNYTAAPGGNIGVGPTNTGATGGNETRPVNAYVNYIVKR